MSGAEYRMTKELRWCSFVYFLSTDVISSNRKVRGFSQPCFNTKVQKKGIAQAVYHSQHKKELETAKELRIPVYELLREGEKFTPKKWEAQIKELTQEYEKQSRRYGRSTVNLAYVELLRHNRKMDERDQKNKDQSQSRQHEKMDRGQKQKKKHQEMEL